jgi:carboxyl-terminal processing protease
MDDSPAKSAGLKVGDQLISIDNKEVEKIDYYQIPKILSNGKVGSLIPLKILRNDETMTFNIARARIVEKSLYINEAFNQSGQSATIFNLRNFSNIDSYFDIKKRLNEKSENHLGWIFDLRNNGGGDMENAQSIAGLFIEDQTPSTNNPRGLKTIYLRQPFNAKDIYFSQKTDVGQKTIEPVVIITNASTASAAEMFASSLRDYERALIIGERSFGKATTQRGDLPNSLTPGLENISDKILNTLQNDFIYYSSFAVFYAPISMSTHQLTGLIPDIEINDPSPYKKTSLREEDLFLNPIKVHSKPFINSDSRLKKIDQAKSCTSQFAFSSEKSTDDIEIRKALDILQCQKN